MIPAVAAHELPMSRHCAVSISRQVQFVSAPRGLLSSAFSRANSLRRRKFMDRPKPAGQVLSAQIR